MGSGRETIEACPKAYKPADSGVTVGNGARSCSFRVVTYNAFKQVLFGDVD